MNRNSISFDSIYIRQKNIAFSNNTYCMICEFFDGFDFIKDG